MLGRCKTNYARSFKLFLTPGGNARTQERVRTYLQVGNATTPDWTSLRPAPYFLCEEGPQHSRETHVCWISADLLTSNFKEQISSGEKKAGTPTQTLFFPTSRSPLLSHFFAEHQPCNATASSPSDFEKSRGNVSHQPMPWALHKRAVLKWRGAVRCDSLLTFVKG